MDFRRMLGEELMESRRLLCPNPAYDGIVLKLSDKKFSNDKESLERNCINNADVVNLYDGLKGQKILGTS